MNVENSGEISEAPQHGGRPMTMREIMEAEDPLPADPELEQLRQDAARWKALVSSPRIRFIGGARLGGRDEILCLEFYADGPCHSPAEKEFALGRLLEYVDRRAQR